MNVIASIRTLIHYRWLLQELIIKDLKIKYRRSILGYLWSVLNPLMMMVIMTIVFSQMFRFDIPNYPVYVLSGHLLYNFYAEATSVGMHSILWGAALMKKVYLPKYIFPLSRVLSSFTTMIFSMLALIIVMVVTGSSFHITAILLPELFLSLLIFSIGMSLILSVMIVFFRDMEHFYGVFLTALCYLTPIFYPMSLLPEWVRELLVYNPLCSYLEFFRKIMLYGVWPSAGEHLMCAGFSLAALLFGLYIFKKKQDKFILYI